MTETPARPATCAIEVRARERRSRATTAWRATASSAAIPRPGFALRGRAPAAPRSATWRTTSASRNARGASSRGAVSRTVRRTPWTLAAFATSRAPPRPSARTPVRRATTTGVLVFHRARVPRLGSAFARRSPCPRLVVAALRRAARRTTAMAKARAPPAHRLRSALLACRTAAARATHRRRRALVTRATKPARPAASTSTNARVARTTAITSRRPA